MFRAKCRHLTFTGRCLALRHADEVQQAGGGDYRGNSFDEHGFGTSRTCTVGYCGSAFATICGRGPLRRFRRSHIRPVALAAKRGQTSRCRERPHSALRMIRKHGGISTPPAAAESHPPPSSPKFNRGCPNSSATKSLPPSCPLSACGPRVARFPATARDSPSPK